MTRFVAGLILGSLVSSAVAFASSPANHNGIFWNELNSAAKDAYINGYGDAMRVSVAKLDSLMTAGDVFHWKDSRKILGGVGAQLSMSELAPDEAVNRLDALYRGKNYRELDVGTALQLLSLHPQLRNASAQSNE